MPASTDDHELEGVSELLYDPKDPMNYQQFGQLISLGGKNTVAVHRGDRIIILSPGITD
jgi:hypothetical protein